MIEERAYELADALESGNYPQGRAMLCRVLPDGTKEWCCLGVACDLAIAAGVAVEVSDPYALTPGYRQIQFDGATGILPVSVMDYFGFKDEVGSFTSPAIPINDTTAVRTLARANDGGVPFTRLAEYIRENWAEI